MRIKLDKGKQRELILEAKGNKTWKEISKILRINEQYLYRELMNEKRLMSDRIYNQLCNLVNKDFDRFILEKLDDNWGRSKGGLNSLGSTKQLPEIKLDEKLAEFVGAVLGDGHLESNKKKGVYHIRIAGDLIKDKDYHINHLKNLVREIFNLNSVEIKRPETNERFLDIYSKKLIEFFVSMGIKPGNKIKNQSTIPVWIWKTNEFIKSCLKGLIDTDGSIFRMSNKNPNLIRINFTNHNSTLLNDTRKLFLVLGFNPSKIINNRQFYISRQEEIKKYLKNIGFSNKKHRNRLNIIKSPVF